MSEGAQPVAEQVQRGRFSKASVRDADVGGRRVLVRVDFNVPLESGEVADDGRIRAALPTIELLRERGASLVLVSHLGRPKDQEPGLSLRPVGACLAELLGREVLVADRVVGDEVGVTAAALEAGQILLLENSRFEPGETKNDPGLADALAGLADVFVNDAFGAAHRSHASTVGVAERLPSYAGLLLEREVRELTALLEDPARPLVVVLGGAKASDKVALIERFLDIADRILIGGAMAFNFFVAQGHSRGESLTDHESILAAGRVLELAESSDCELLLPVDVVIGDRFDAQAERQNLDGIDVPEGWMGLDVGAATAALYADAIAAAGSVFWNGPMGAFELAPFCEGTRRVAEAVAATGATTVVGGGDSAAALRAFGLEDSVDWLSTGGGASLELLEGKPLPGVEALLDAEGPRA